MESSVWRKGVVGTLGASVPILLSGLLLAGASFAASAQQLSQMTGGLLGTVAEAGSGQPIAQALVRVVGTEESAITNATGQFTLRGIDTGTYALEVSALGYETLTTDPMVISRSIEARVTVELVAAPLSVERLLVTANKAARSALDVTAFTSVVEREDIDARGDIELVDALENAPGIMHTAQAGSFESIELRGMPRGGNEFETTLLLIDGVPQTDSRNSARVINLPIDNADAIEVVHGPNSALYGRTAIGGAINVITAQPTSEPRATADFQIGEFGHRRAAISASGPVEDWAGYYFSWASADNGGYYTRDPDYDIDETSVFAKLSFTPDDRSTAMVSLNNVTSDNSLPTSVPVIGGQLLSDIEPGFDILSNINLPTANFHQEELRLTTNYQRELDRDMTFTNTFAYRDIQYKFEESGDIIGAPYDLAANTLTMYPFSLQTDEEVFYEEARLSLRPTLGGLDQQLLVGASYERTTGFRSGDLIYTDAATFGMQVNFLNPIVPSRDTWIYFPFGGDEYSLDSFGLFFQYNLLPHPRLELTAAGRLDWFALENTETFQTGSPSIKDKINVDDPDAFSPKLSALYRLLEGSRVGFLGEVDLNVYATYSQAFKPPRTPSGLNPAGTDPPLDPEDITNYEAGIKSVFADGRVSLDATVFHMERDGIVISTRQGPFFAPSNAGRQNFDGLELAAAWAPTPRLSVSSNLALYHNRFGDFVIQTVAGDLDLTDNRLPLVPDRIFNIGGSYAPHDDVQLTVGLKSVSDRFVDQRNGLLLDGYGLVDASVSWSPGPVRLTAAVHNLMDKQYSNNGDTSLAESISIGAPRQLVVGVSLIRD